LQRFQLSQGLTAVAMDESTSMGRLTKRKTADSARLTRGLAQHLPFCDKSFDSIITTFPAEYITDPQTLLEAKRCLSDGGRFIVLPVAIPKNQFLFWLFKVTSQASSDALKVVREKLSEPFIKSEFDVEAHVLEIKSATLIVIIATKPH